MQAAAINAELLARRQENVLLLLALLEDEPVGVLSTQHERTQPGHVISVQWQACLIIHLVCATIALRRFARAIMSDKFARDACSMFYLTSGR